MSISRRGDNVVQFPVGPTNELSGAAIDQAALTSAGGSIVMRVYDAAKEARVALFESRLRAAVVSTDTDIQMPWFQDTPLEANDVIGYIDGNGLPRERTISSVVTTGRDYTTLTLSAQVGTDLPKHHAFYLVHKATTATVIPIDISPANLPYMLADGDTIEVENSAQGLNATSLTRITASDAMELASDGVVTARAVNQPSYYLALIGSSAGVTTLPGARVRAKLGSDITAVEYGTVLAGSEEWGFASTIPDTLVLPDNGLVELEVEMDAGDGLRLVEAWEEKVVD